MPNIMLRPAPIVRRGPVVRSSLRPIVKDGGACGCSKPLLRRVREPVVVKTTIPEDVDPIILTGKRPGTKCRPFLKIEKDSEKFAACNALSDEIGPLDDPKKAFRVIGEAIGDEVNEVFGVLTLDIHLRLKSIAETGRGEPSAVMAPMVPTLQAAVMDGAHAVIIFHVHPSGVKAEPSEADQDTTDAFVDAFDTIGIVFIDHVIVAGDSRKRSYYSFLEDNKI